MEQLRDAESAWRAGGNRRVIAPAVRQILEDVSTSNAGFAMDEGPLDGFGNTELFSIDILGLDRESGSDG